MDNSIKIWSLDDADVQLAARRSYLCEQRRSDSTAEGSFKACFAQFPVFTSSSVHSDYVDCVIWAGNFILSKSTDNKIVMWHPDASRRNNEVVVVKEFLFADANIWFVRFSLDKASRFMAVGSKCGNVYVWDTN